MLRDLRYGLLVLGVMLLAFVHTKWCLGHEAAEVKMARYFLPAMAGWALTTMGYLGILLTPTGQQKEGRGFPVIPTAGESDR